MDFSDLPLVVSKLRERSQITSSPIWQSWGGGTPLPPSNVIAASSRRLPPRVSVIAGAPPPPVEWHALDEQHKLVVVDCRTLSSQDDTIPVVTDEDQSNSAQFPPVRIVKLTFSSPQTNARDFQDVYK